MTTADALQAWRAVRAAVNWTAFPERRGPVLGVRDGHRHFLDSVVRPRDPRRAQRLHAALDLVRADAAQGAPLGLERLVAWQQLGVGEAEARLRCTDAFAKQGDERYGYGDDLDTEIDRCLREADDASVPLPARAARVYLDVAFFHPFVDGNGRSAALALDFVLSRADVVLDQVGPLFLVSRRADDLEGARGFVGLVDTLIGATQARSAARVT